MITMTDNLRLVLGLTIWALSFGLIANAIFFFANLKIYTEIMKEKSQRIRNASNGD